MKRFRIRILFNPMLQSGKGIITECRNYLGKQWKLSTHVTDDTVHFIFNNCGSSDLSEKSAWPQYYCIDICWMQRYITYLCEQIYFLRCRDPQNWNVTKRVELDVDFKKMSDSQLLEALRKDPDIGNPLQINPREK